MKSKRITLCVLFLLNLVGLYAQQDLSGLSWNKVASRMPVEWYATEQAVQIADTVLAYQTALGGWPKNTGFHKIVNHEEMAKIKGSGIGATFDNGATITEMRFLAKIYSYKKDIKYKLAFMKAFNYILISQYDNGGWPQFYPIRKGRSVAYSGCITFNDNAYINVMNLLRDIFLDSEEIKVFNLDEVIKEQARSSFEKGLQCILDTQIRINGERTVWCAQYDPKTLEPVKARAYELPSFSGAESAKITLLLMSIPNPTQEIIASVQGAVKWFEEHKIENMAYERYLDEEGEKNSRVVPAKGNIIWARFYDLNTGKPFFCDRDGVQRSSIDELSKERRGGYSWYVSSPIQVLNNYPIWTKQNNF